MVRLFDEAFQRLGILTWTSKRHTIESFIFCVFEEGPQFGGIIAETTTKWERRRGAGGYSRADQIFVGYLSLHPRRLQLHFMDNQWA